MGYLEDIKIFFKSKKSLSTYLVWAFRAFVLVGVLYLIFFNQEKVVTNFEPNETESTEVLDFKIQENKDVDSVLKTLRDEKNYIDSISNDSLRKIILRTDNPN